jgi:hypothetical protein
MGTKTPPPRPPVKPAHVQAATTKVGTVDLTKILDMRKVERAERSAKTLVLNAKKDEIANEFLAAYRSQFKGEFQLRSQRQWRNWTDTKGKVFHRRLPTDKQRLWETWQRAERAYAATIDEFKTYMVVACQQAADKYKVENPRQVFGYLNHEGVLEAYFMKLRAGAVRGRDNDKIQDRAQAHAELFER